MWLFEIFEDKETTQERRYLRKMRDQYKRSLQRSKDKKYKIQEKFSSYNNKIYNNFKYSSYFEAKEDNNYLYDARDNQYIRASIRKRLEEIDNIIASKPDAIQSFYSNIFDFNVFVNAQTGEPADSNSNFSYITSSENNIKELESFLNSSYIYGSMFGSANPKNDYNSLINFAKNYEKNPQKPKLKPIISKELAKYFAQVTATYNKEPTYKDKAFEVRKESVKTLYRIKQIDDLIKLLENSNKA